MAEVLAKDVIYVPKGLAKDGYLDFSNWEEAKKAMDANWEALSKCDEVARKNKIFIGRIFSIGVADGKAMYQVIGETKTRFKVQHCTGLGDDYADHHFGYGGSFSKKEVLRYLDWEDGMRALFAKNSKKK